VGVLHGGDAGSRTRVRRNELAIGYKLSQRFVFILANLADAIGVDHRTGLSSRFARAPARAPRHFGARSRPVRERSRQTSRPD
jgi:hypothetical protein